MTATYINHHHLTKSRFYKTVMNSLSERSSLHLQILGGQTVLIRAYLFLCHPLIHMRYYWYMHTLESSFYECMFIEVWHSYLQSFHFSGDNETRCRRRIIWWRWSGAFELILCGLVVHGYSQALAFFVQHGCHFHLQLYSSVPTVKNDFIGKR